MFRVYLAGGMKDGWQDRFMLTLDGVEYFDPRTHGLTDPAAYTEWDLRHVRLADAVVAYMDPANPSGYGLSLEIGYAHALGKRIVFIDAFGADWRGKYFDMHRQLCEVAPSIAHAQAIIQKCKNMRAAT